MKKIFEYIGLMSLMCFSFFITEKTVNVVKEVDDIMVQIKANKDNYSTSGIDALILRDTIVPGISSKKVNIDKSYKAMKKIGVYDSAFLVYDINKPEKSIDNYFDKYIIKGNSSKRMVSLIFLVEDKDMESVLNIVGDTKVSFIVQNYIIQKENKAITNAFKQGKEFIVTDDDIREYNASIEKLKSLGIKINYCYNPHKNKDLLLRCKNNKQYSLTALPIITQKALQTVKGSLQPGAILVFKINKNVLAELPNIISYIEFKGYKIELLANHIKED
jgi:hypothetical protein